MDRRQFAKRGVLTIVGLGLTSTAFKCGSKSVTFYVSTISSFLNELGTLIPAQAGFIGKIVKVAADFDAAYQRGDFANASTFFNTMVENITTLTNDLGVTLSDRGKMLLSVVSVTVRTIAVLLRDEGATQPAAISSARATSPAASKAIGAIRTLAAGAGETFAATKLN